MERRFEAYKTRVVRPFFRDHFQRIDRQIVLVDVLAAWTPARRRWPNWKRRSTGC